MKKRPIVAALISTLAVLPLCLVQAQEDGATKPEGTPGGPSGSAETKKPGGPQAGDRRGPGGPGGERGDRGPSRPKPPTFEELDIDGSGDVTQDEFVAYQVKQAEERAKQMFGRVDRNNDGKLTKEEMPKPREGGPRGPGMRDGEGGPRGPRDGEGGGPRGPRDGQKPGGDNRGTEPKRPDVES